MRTLLLVLILSSITVACSPSAPPTPLEPLTIGINVWAGYAYAHIADQKGFFKKHHANVKLVFIPNYDDLLQEYRSGKVDGLYATLNDLIILNCEGLATQIVYISDHSDAGDVIVGKPELQGLHDLKGKMVSFEGTGSFSQLLVIKLLEKAGIQEGEFQAINLPANQVLTALESGKIEAGHTWEPITTQAVQKGYQILGKAGDIPGLILDVLAFNRTIIEQRPQEVQGVVNAMLEAHQFLQQHRLEAIQIMATAQGMSPQEMAAGLNKVHLFDLSENLAAMIPNGIGFTSGQLSIDFFLQKGRIFKAPDLNAILIPHFIQTAQSTPTSP